MKNKILNSIFCILSLILFGQKRLYSPFKLSDYENLKNEYINAIDINKDLLKSVDNYYLVKNKLDSIPSTENNLKSIFTISKDNFTYYYRPNNDELIISFPNDDLKIVYWFQGDTNSEFINNNKIRTWNRYFSKNGQIKHSYTNLLSNNEQIGVSEEYNIIGKRLFYANWDKDFKSTKQDAIKLSKKHLSKCVNDYNKNNNFYLSVEEIMNIINAKSNKTPETYKFINENREPNWLIIYNGEPKIEIKLSDKTGKLIDCQLSYSIE